jgi:iron uptake system component EfeO
VRGLGALAVGAALLLAACGNDDGNAVRDTSGTGSGSGSASASGISPTDLGNQTSDPVLREAVDHYGLYVQNQVETLIAETKTFTDAVRAGNTAEAKASFPVSRQAWESIEPIAALVEEIDGKVDARVEDFESETDPAWTGWHRIEYLIWEEDEIGEAEPFADQLDSDLTTLKSELPKIELTPLAMAKGAPELIEEVSEGKITGEEDRYSKTDLWDFRANVDGSAKVIEFLTPALDAKDPALLKQIEDEFAALDATLAKYRDGSGWKSFDTLTTADTDALKAELAALSESLAKVPGVLGLG